MRHHGARKMMNGRTSRTMSQVGSIHGSNWVGSHRKSVVLVQPSVKDGLRTYKLMGNVSTNYSHKLNWWSSRLSVKLVRDYY